MATVGVCNVAGESAGWQILSHLGGQCADRLVNSGDILHGACNPIAGLCGQQVNAIVVNCIGGGALSKLNATGMRVFQAREGTVAENIALFRTNGLQEYMPGHTCGGHGHSHGCSH